MVNALRFAIRCTDEPDNAVSLMAEYQGFLNMDSDGYYPGRLVKCVSACASSDTLLRANDFDSVLSYSYGLLICPVVNNLSEDGRQNLLAVQSGNGNGWTGLDMSIRHKAKEC